MHLNCYVSLLNPLKLRPKKENRRKKKKKKNKCLPSKGYPNNENDHDKEICVGKVGVDLV